MERDHLALEGIKNAEAEPTRTERALNRYDELEIMLKDLK